MVTRAEYTQFRLPGYTLPLEIHTLTRAERTRARTGWQEDGARDPGVGEWEVFVPEFAAVGFVEVSLFKFIAEFRSGA